MRTCFLAGAVASAAALISAPALSSTPTLMWQDAKAVRVHCLVGPGHEPGARRLQQGLCDRVVKFAAQGTRLPVSTIALGDPQMIAPGTVTLLVHGFVEQDGGKRLLAFSIRPFRNSAGDAGLLFGSPPRAASLNADGQPTPALDAALKTALADTLPWQSRPSEPRALPINN
jgi:hypothetical protein